jgi:hypothetical protein
MPSTSPKKNEERITKVLQAWQTLRPDKTFAGLTLDQFKTQIQPSFTTRDTIVAIDNQLIAAQNQRNEADKQSLETVRLVINAVKGDVDEGPNGDLYEAMGFVPDKERKSGLSRGKRPAATTA